MNEEKKRQLMVYIKLFIIIICAGLYAWGGIEHKFLRRFVAPAIACIFSFIYSRDWKYFVQMPFMFLTMSMGYGADTFTGKVLRRGLFGMANGASSSIVTLLSRRFFISVFQVLLIIAAYIVFGVFNPFFNARIEETVLGLYCYALPILAVRYYKEKEDYV